MTATDPTTPQRPLGRDTRAGRAAIAEVEAAGRAMRSRSVKQLEAGVIAMMNRAASPGPARDGFPVRSSQPARQPEVGEEPPVPWTPVERMAVAADPLPAEVDWHAAQARRRFLDAAEALAEVEQLVRLVGRDEAEVRPQWCEACAVAGVEHAFDHFSDVGGILDHAMYLCRSAMDFIRRFGIAPIEGEVQYHERTGRWKHRIDPGKGRAG